MIRVQPKSRKAWRTWLARHHATSSGVWLVYAKKHTGIPSLSYSDAVEEALCFGWIDNKINTLDDQFYMQAFTPRRPGSGWSALNKQRTARLIADRLMTPAGQQMIDLARETGTWNAFDHIEALTMPDDFRQALARNAKARRTFEAWPPMTKKQCFYRLHAGKRPETRARYLADIVAAAADGRNPFRLPVRTTTAVTKTTAAKKGARTKTT